MRCVVVSLCTVLCSTAAADGLYFTESFGVSMGRGDVESTVGRPMHIRVAIGARYGSFALEPWLTSALQLSREGAWQDFIGGEPPDGMADLATWGVDAKYILPLDDKLSAYVRGGPVFASGTGALEGYSGRGFGASYGMQVTGKVRALGFLWTPLFFVDKGPKVTAALYLDAGYDFYTLRMNGAPTLDARVGHVSVGFAVGQTF